MKSSINWDEALEQAKEIMRNRVNEITYECWIKDLKFSNYIDGVVTLEVTEVQESALNDKASESVYGQTLHQILIGALNQVTSCVNDIKYVREVITYEDVMKRLNGIPIEQYTKQDLFDRYIAYGSEEELQNTKVQKLLVKNGYAQELLEVATKIDDEVMEEIFQTMEDTKATVQ